MGRTSKFSFSLSGRKSSLANDKEERREAPQWTSSAARQNSLGMSKVERLLGTTGLPVRPSPSYDTLERATLNSKPSYMTLTASEASGDDRSHVSRDSPGRSNYYRPPRNQSLRHQASSNVLGRSGHLVDQVADSSSLNTRDLRSEYSSATLRSYYESHKAPLLVSQQTSNSAVRDLALRKGLDPVVPTTPRDESYAGPEDPRTHQHTSAAPSFASTTLEQRQRKMDITTLFPRPRTSSGNVLGAGDMVTSPSQLSLASEFPLQRRQVSSPAPPVRKASRSRTVLQKPQPDAARLSKRPSNASSLRRDEPYDNPKNNIRRPPKGIQNWFDGLLEEVDDDYGTDESDGEDEMPQDQPQHQHHPPAQSTVRSVPSTASTISEKPADPPPGGSRYFNSHSNPDRPLAGNRLGPFNPLRSHPPGRKHNGSPILRNADAEGEARFGASDTSDGSPSRSTSISESPRRPLHQPISEPLPASGPTTHAPEASAADSKRRSLASHNTMASEGSRANRLTQVDLRNSSALSMSSSSEEEEDAEDVDYDSHRPHVRDSIAISEISADNVMIGRARAFEIRPSERRLNEFKRAPRPVNLREFAASDIAEELPPEPRSAGPTTTVAPSNQTLSTLTRPDSGAEPVRPHTSAAHVPVASRASITSANREPSSAAGEDADATGLGHKLMAVTPEEEALLEMMRSKRVAMAELSFKEGYETALKQGQRRKSSEPPSANHDSLLAAVEAVVQASASRRQDHAADTQAQQPASLPQSSLTDKDKAEEAAITAESTFTEIMDAFPAPSPTSNRFSTTFVPRAEQRNTSPGFSAASSSRQGRAKRHSNLSTVSSSMEDTSGTSATSSSPMSKQKAPGADHNSTSGDTSNASTIKRQEAVNRLSLTPVGASVGLPPAAKPAEKPANSSIVRPAITPGEQEQDHFGELTIGASESIVGNNDTDDLSSPHLHEGVSAALVAPSLPPSLPLPAEGPLGRSAKRRSMRIDVSSDPPSRPPSFAAPESPRKLPERRISRGTEYRLTPKIPSVSPTSPAFPPQLQHGARAFSVPTQSQPSGSSASTDSSSRPRVLSASSAPANDTPVPEAEESKSMPRNSNIANVKNAFSLQRESSPKTAPLPVDQPAELENSTSGVSKRFSRSSLRSDSEKLSKRFSLASLHGESERFSKRFSKSSVHGKAFDGGQRSSVSEDVLNAWTSLGGWRGLDSLRGEA